MNLQDDMVLDVRSRAAAASRRGIFVVLFFGGKSSEVSEALETCGMFLLKIIRFNPSA